MENSINDTMTNHFENASNRFDHGGYGIVTNIFALYSINLVHSIVENFKTLPLVKASNVWFHIFNKL